MPNYSEYARQVGVKNALNTVSRTAMLQGSLSKFPAGYNCLAWCYHTPCALYSQGQMRAQSKAGAHQGDAIGPLGYALGLGAALDKCATDETSVEWATWYLDDGTIPYPSP